MNRLELVTETVRASLNDLAEAAPDWLRALAAEQWYERYARRIEEARLPKSEAARKSFAEQVGQDGFALLDALADAHTPAGLADLPAVQTLRQVWQRHYERTAQGRALWRAGPDLSRAAGAIESPYDPEARCRTKRDNQHNQRQARRQRTAHAQSWAGKKPICRMGLPRLSRVVRSRPGRAPVRSGPSTRFVIPVLEPLVDNRHIGRESNAVQIHDIAIHHQLEEAGVHPALSGVAGARERDLGQDPICCLTRRSVDANSRVKGHAKSGVRTTHQQDGCSFASDLQEMRPGRFKVLPLGERDFVVQPQDLRTL